MELALVRSLLNKDFYENHRGDRCPLKLFSKDVSKLFQQVIGDEIANLGFDCINGTLKNLQPLHNLLEKYGDDFIPKVTVKWEDISMDALLEAEQGKYRWKFNLTSLARRIPGVNAGQLVEVGARPNTGKTSFHASILSGKNGFIEQGASCVVLLNEEKYDRVILRYLNAATNESSETIIKNKEKYYDYWKTKRRPHLKVADGSDRQMSWVESVCKYYNPDILVLDMGDKFAETNSSMRGDELLKRNVVYARQIAKKYECCIFYMSQLSADAEGRVKLDQSMMEDQDPFRYVNVVKNKLNGWHGMITCEFDHTKSLYTA